MTSVTRLVSQDQCDKMCYKTSVTNSVTMVTKIKIYCLLSEKSAIVKMGHRSSMASVTILVL